MSGAEALPFLSLGLRAAKISWEIYNLTKKFQKAPEIIQAHAKDLEVFENLLQMLQTTLQSNWDILSPRAQEVVSMTVTNCEDIFAEFDALVEQLRMSVKDGEKVVSFSRRRLIMKESSVRLLMLRLAGAKSNVGLLLQMFPRDVVQSGALLYVFLLLCRLFANIASVLGLLLFQRRRRQSLRMNRSLRTWMRSNMNIRKQG